MYLKNTTTIITGSSRGIGYAILELLKLKKYPFIGSYKESNLNTDGYLPLNIGSNDSILEFVSSCEATLSTTTPIVLINNAGVGLDIQDLTLDISKLKTSLDINLLGTVHLTELLLEKYPNINMIINLTSDFSLFGNTYVSGPAYSISKAGLNFYTVWLSNKYTNIKTIGYIPGWVKTSMGGVEAPIAAEDVAMDLINLIEHSSKVISGKLYKFREGLIRW